MSYFDPNVRCNFMIPRSPYCSKIIIIVIMFFRWRQTSGYHDTLWYHHTRLALLVSLHSFFPLPTKNQIWKIYVVQYSYDLACLDVNIVISKPDIQMPPFPHVYFSPLSFTHSCVLLFLSLYASFYFFPHNASVSVWTSVFTEKSRGGKIWHNLISRFCIYGPMPKEKHTLKHECVMFTLFNTLRCM